MWAQSKKTQFFGQSDLDAKMVTETETKAMDSSIARNMYGKYSVPGGLMHRPAVRIVTSGDVYEPKTIAFMRNMVGDGDIIHAGTFFGDFLPGLSERITEGRKIWAYEPNPNSFDNAAKTIKLNDLKNVKLQHFAVSKQSGDVLFRTHNKRGYPLGGHSHFAAQQGSGVVSVPAVRLDQSVPLDRPVSILQLDVEGHERAAVKGARGIIEKWRPILILEDFDRPRWMQSQFPGLGYKQVGKLHSNLVYATEEIDVGGNS